ncbi:DUF4440 domain-containing protein [Bosea caraganae]|uniref:DUF4440 domain-containing protein n=1 Tax=Bosea caraganae TaxID=2763117 RepID=A0A370L9D5_9HYPH|nr:nuclear transport factor 2 family protein [Bosea caraganae]RDJ22035.1 DUF4440 domain-containing protein [Bosea caraganae]RDJ27932.1 DUF4440 domain-containing protein [Bosea caraganae]
MKLPSIVETYFEAEKRGDADALARAFAADAVVKDEGAVHTGPDQIRAWWLAAKEKYHHVAEPLDVTEQGGKVTVRAKVSGQFPNSPAILQFVFGLRGDTIVDLEIH